MQKLTAEHFSNTFRSLKNKIDQLRLTSYEREEMLSDLVDLKYQYEQLLNQYKKTNASST